MLCANCNKESNNLRVCPYCFTPYPEAQDGPVRRATRRTTAVSGTNPVVPGGSKSGGRSRASALDGLRAFVMRQTPVVRWSAFGMLVVAVLWVVTGPGGSRIPVGVEQPPVIATPMQRNEALAIIRQTRETALVDVQQDEVFVSYPAATFPVREEGQLALVQQFAEADAMVEGRRRRIFFYNPNGKLFAQADASRGVILVR